MKYFVTFLFVSFFSVQASNACSVVPFDAEEAFRSYDLEASALAALELKKEDVYDTQVTVDGEYVWGPMCPRGHMVTAIFEVKYRSPDSSNKECMGVAKVTRRKASEVDHFGMQEPSEDRVIVDILQSPGCSE